jgi:hypothetical protein
MEVEKKHYYLSKVDKSDNINNSNFYVNFLKFHENLCIKNKI